MNTKRMCLGIVAATYIAFNAYAVQEKFERKGLVQKTHFTHLQEHKYKLRCIIYCPIYSCEYSRKGTPAVITRALI